MNSFILASNITQTYPYSFRHVNLLRIRTSSAQTIHLTEFYLQRKTIFYLFSLSHRSKPSATNTVKSLGLIVKIPAQTQQYKANKDIKKNYEKNIGNKHIRFGSISISICLGWEGLKIAINQAPYFPWIMLLFSKNNLYIRFNFSTITHYLWRIWIIDGPFMELLTIGKKL